MNKNLNIVKGVTVAVLVASLGVAGYLFHQHRVYQEPTVLSEGVTEIKRLSDYSDAIKPGSINDCNVYIWDSGVPGGSMLMFGGSHPEEPASVATANLFAENMQVKQGRIFLINRINTSGSCCTRPGEAYPRFVSVDTEWGEKTWRFGDRVASPLDSWPDPDVYIHYPSGQNLAYMDIRNLNRNWPGKANGLVTERTTYAVMEMIRQEGINMTMDWHEAELEYPVINTIVVHQNGSDVAAMASMVLSSQVFDVPIGMEFSPKTLHGLSHREIGDYSDAVSYLMEVAEPMLDRIRGITDEQLAMSGKDRFVMMAGDHHLLYSPIDEAGWPIEKRVGRHVHATCEIIKTNNMVHPEQTIILEGLPTYDEIVANGIGAYYHDPATAPAERVVYD